jgi:hypothetical protein
MLWKLSILGIVVCLILWFGLLTGAIPEPTLFAFITLSVSTAAFLLTFLLGSKDS